jgi:transposase
VVINEQDQVVYQKRLPNDLSLVAQQLSTYRASLEGIVVESTYNWYWLVDGLMEKGYRLHLANTAAIQPYNGLKYTDDHSDARWLAHLLRLGVLPEGYIYPKQEIACADQGSRRRASAGRIDRLFGQILWAQLSYKTNSKDQQARELRRAKTGMNDQS